MYMHACIHAYMYKAKIDVSIDTIIYEYTYDIA